MTGATTCPTRQMARLVWTMRIVQAACALHGTSMWTNPPRAYAPRRTVRRAGTRPITPNITRGTKPCALRITKRHFDALVGMETSHCGTPIRTGVLHHKHYLATCVQQIYEAMLGAAQMDSALTPAMLRVRWTAVAAFVRAHLLTLSVPPKLGEDLKVSRATTPVSAVSKMVINWCAILLPTRASSAHRQLCLHHHHHHRCHRLRLRIHHLPHLLFDCHHHHRLRIHHHHLHHPRLQQTRPSHPLVLHHRRDATTTQLLPRSLTISRMCATRGLTLTAWPLGARGAWGFGRSNGWSKPVRRRAGYVRTRACHDQHLLCTFLHLGGDVVISHAPSQIWALHQLCVES